MTDRPAELAAALAAIANPLRFAARDDFEHLDRVVDLEATLRRGAERALALDPPPAVTELLRTFLTTLPPDGEARDQRVTALRACLALHDEGSRLLHGEPAPAAPGRPAAAAPVGPAPAAERPGRASEGPQRLPKATSSPELMAEAAGDSRPGSPARAVPVATPAVPPDGEVSGDAAAAARPPRIRSQRPATGAKLSLDSPVQYVKGVGPRLAEILNAADVRTVEDLLHFLPRRYEDRRAIAAICDLQEGVHATVEVEVLARSERRYHGKRGLDVAVGDASGVMHLAWFRTPGEGFAERFQKGRRLRVSGQVRFYRGQPQMVHPETMMLSEAVDEESAADAIVPVYAEIEGLRPAHLRRVVQGALPAAAELVEVLPDWIRIRRGLPPLAEAIRTLHAPPPDTELEALHRYATPWHARLIYEELLFVQLAVLRRKAEAQSQPGHAIPLSESLLDEAKRLFPFAMTGAQVRVLAEIEGDLKRSIPMNRLLQGDVGSGKTAVAVAAAAAVARAGLQAAIMAPTELLAEQHGRVALTALAAAGFRVALLTGAVVGQERKQILQDLESGKCQVIIGTHALIQEEVRFHKMALAIVDEQHRFGVRQRARLVAMGRESLGSAPHMLVMTATPIPRTLALTVYGDLDLSLVDELPPGRTPAETFLYRENQRDQVYARVRQVVEQGQQAYVVFPLVEESESEDLEGVRDATSAALELKNGYLKGLEIGLIHGRIPSDDKDRLMRAFVRGDIQVLVATTVIEVGIDVANATIMVVEHAERFGLSQLHQLRGRVGRGKHRGLCLLVARYTHSEDAWRRLKIMEATNDGFRIAEEDLSIRGPGDFLGTRQSGIPLLSTANLARDQKILQQAREDAAELLQTDASLEKPEHRLLRERVTRLWQEKLDLAQVG